MSNADHIARGAVDRMNMSPAMISPSFAMSAAADLRTLAAADSDKEIAKMAEARTMMLAAFGLSPAGEANKPFAFSNGFAIIPVTGMLLNRFGYSWGSYATGYNFIRSQLNAALADPDVENIVFDMNSYGGEVAGCFELVEDIYASRAIKPSLAVVDSNCYSACYALASACSKIIVTPSGGVGSIGVVCMHVSYEKLLATAGIEITFVHAGKHKVDGNPYQDLPEDVKAHLQGVMDQSRQKFAAMVARNRGLEVQAVLDTEAQVYRVEEAMVLGLIDAVEPPTKAIAAFINELSGSDEEMESNMDATKPGAESSTTQNADAVAAAVATALRADRERMAAIKNLPEAAGREKLADYLALSTSMSADEAKGVLAAAATDVKAEPAAKTNSFEAAMSNTQNPNVGGGEGGDESKAKASKSVLADFAAATGRRFDK